MSTAIYTVISLPILIGIASLAVDIGLINNEKNRLQLAADASSVAAAEYITADNDHQIIHSEAVQISSLHRDFDSSIEPSQVQTELGVFNSDGSFSPDPEGEYIRVTITNDSLPTIFGSIFGFRNYHVSASSISGKVSTTVTDCVPTMENEWPCLLFASEGLELTGNFNISMSGSLANASACTNASEITLGGNLSIGNGIDLHMGPDCPYTNGIGCIDSHGSSYNFQGSASPMGSEYQLPAVDYPEDYLALPNGVRVGGRNSNITVTNLAAGETYFIDGNLTTTNNQSINIQNVSNGCLSPSGELRPTVIYVNGDVSLSGGVSGNINHPECFEIKVIGDRTVRINGRTDFYGSIYAPESEVYPNGNARFHGSIVAGSIRANGNHDLILSSTLGGRVPNVSDDITCEESEVVISKVRVVQ